MSVRRVSVHTDRDGDPVTVDVGLPSGAPVGELLPAIVDMVDGRFAPDTGAVRWRLDRAGGGVLNEQLSLVDNGIDDGELLTLSRGHAPALGPLRVELGHAAAAAPMFGADTAPNLPAAFCTTAATLASVVLAATAGSPHAMTNAIIAAAGACAAATVAVATGFGTSSCLAVVSLAAAAGFLAVPSDPAAPNAFLAAGAALSASILMLRLSGRMSATLVATAAFSLLTAVVAVSGLPVVAVGAALSSASLVLLALAPRLSVLVSGFGAEEVNDRVEAAHGALSGLVAGSAAGASAGALVVAAGVVTGGSAAGIPAAQGFTALLAMVAFLRARTFLDPVRRITLCAAGFSCGIASLGLALDSHREYVGAAGGILVATALLAIRRPRTGDFWSRTIDRCDYAALVAVLPLAAWVGGVYDLVGGLRP